MANINLLYGTWMLNETVDINVNVSIDFTCTLNDSESEEWDKIYGIGSVELAYSKNDSKWAFPYRSDSGWSFESARTIKVSTESNSNALSWLQTNAVKLSDDLNYTNSVNKYNDLMNELSDVINNKAGTTGKKVLSQIVETAKTIKKGITPTGTVNITTNGTHNVTNYASANVNVPVPSDYIKPSGNLSITSNGDYNVKEKESVSVNVPNSGAPIEVATAAAMDALLVTENIGKVYKYVGTNDDTYTNGELYQVIEEA